MLSIPQPLLLSDYGCCSGSGSASVNHHGWTVAYAAINLQCCPVADAAVNLQGFPIADASIAILPPVQRQ